MTIIHRGTLTLTKLKELADKHLPKVVQEDDHLYNPVKNHEAISLIKQWDGNWKGYMWRKDKIIEARQGIPENVLTMLLTHE